MITCPNCGENTYAKTKFCPKCGYKIIDNDVDKVEPKWFVLGLLTGIFAIIWFFRYRDYFPKRVTTILIGAIINLSIIVMSLVIGLLFIIF